MSLLGFPLDIQPSQDPAKKTGRASAATATKTPNTNVSVMNMLCPLWTFVAALLDIVAGRSRFRGRSEMAAGERVCRVIETQGSAYSSTLEVQVANSSFGDPLQYKPAISMRACGSSIITQHPD